MRKFVECYVEVQGFHRWENAPKQVDYLASKHRHIFTIRMRIEVQDSDRQVEIITKQDEIVAYLMEKYGNGTTCDFDGMACEHIAKDLLSAFNAESVTVLEDGFGGACVAR